MNATSRTCHRSSPALLILGLLILSAGAGLISGCASSRRVGGSRLSAAVDEARHDAGQSERGDREDRRERKHRERDERERPRVLHAGREVPEPVVVEIETRDRGRHHHRRHSTADAEPVNLSLGLSAGRSGFENHSLEQSQFLALELRGSLPEACSRVELGGTLAGSMLDVEPGLSGALRNVAELSVGVNVRWYASSRPSATGFYGTAGFDLGALHWDYASPVLIEDAGTLYEVDDDWVGTYSPYAGLGVTLFGSGDVQVGARFLCGYTFFDRHTREGLYNDIFDPAPFARVQFDLSHRIR